MLNSFSKSDENTKCLFCLSKVNLKIRPVFRHQKPNKEQCSQLICIWCCYQKIYKENNLKVNKDEDTQLKCCKGFISNLTKKMEDFLDKNCVVCGPNCKSQRFNFDEYKKLHVGKKCYLNISNKWSLLFNEQKQLEAKISKLINSKCLNCSDSFNSIKATKEQLEINFCSKCHKKSLKQQEKDLKSIKKCSKCSQTDVYQKFQIKYHFWEQKKKLLAIIQFKVDQKPSFFCPFCLFQQYLNLQLRQKNNSLLPQDILNLKRKFQLHFSKFCLMCGYCSQEDDQVYLIKSSYQSLASFMCKKCAKSILANKCRFQRIQECFKFLQKTNQFESLKKPIKKYQLNIKDSSKKEKQSGKKRNQCFNQIMRQKQMQGDKYNMDSENNVNKNEQKSTKIGEPQLQSFAQNHENNLSDFQIMDKNTSEMDEQKGNKEIDKIFENDEESFLQNDLSSKAELIDKIDGYDDDPQIKIEQIQEIKLKQQLIDYTQIDESESFTKEVLSMKLIHNQIIQSSLQALLSELALLYHEGESINCIRYASCKSKQPVLNLDLLCDPCFYMYLLNQFNDPKVEEQISQKINKQQKIFQNILKISQ